MDALIITLFFSTGDASAPYKTVAIIIDPTYIKKSIENAINTEIQKASGKEELKYSEIVESALNSLDYTWKFFSNLNGEDNIIGLDYIFV